MKIRIKKLFLSIFAICLCDAPVDVNFLNLKVQFALQDQGIVTHVMRLDDYSNPQSFIDSLITEQGLKKGSVESLIGFFKEKAPEKIPSFDPDLPINMLIQMVDMNSLWLYFGQPSREKYAITNGFFGAGLQQIIIENYTLAQSEAGPLLPIRESSGSSSWSTRANIENIEDEMGCDYEYVLPEEVVPVVAASRPKWNESFLTHSTSLRDMKTIDNLNLSPRKREPSPCTPPPRPNNIKTINALNLERTKTKS